VRITRYQSLSEPQLLGCLSAFVDSLRGELNAAAMYLRKLEGQSKGRAFAYEMALDRHRYGALMMLDRWSRLVGTFASNLQLSRHQSVIYEAGRRVAAAVEILERTNAVIDAAEQYSIEMVAACGLAFQAVEAAFEEERHAAEQSAKLGPLLPAEFTEARNTFLRDLAAR
jgi:hypothetical protein